MNIIIVGCGRVGYILAANLSKEKHNVTLVDTSESKLQPALSNLDVSTLVANGTTYTGLKEAGIKSCDLLIAVTSLDEINMVSCMLAKQVNPRCQTIARIRKPEYLPDINYFKTALGMSMIINPELAAAREMNQLISIPAAIEMDTFAHGRVELLRYDITEDSMLNGMSVMEVSKKFDRKILICILLRNDEVIIPNGAVRLMAGDSISVILAHSMIAKFFNEVSDSKLKSIRNVMIAGGGTTCFYLADMLIEAGVHVKILEKNEARCKELAAHLPKAEILFADASNRENLLENGLEDMDAFVALTPIDEENVFLSLFANKVAPNCKLITKVNKLEQDEIIRSLPVGSLITPRSITVENILQHVRASQKSKGTKVEALYRLMNDKVEAMEFSIREESDILEKPIMDLHIKHNVLLCAIVRGRHVITPSGRDVLHLGDTVVIVTTNQGLNDIKEIIER